MRGKATTRAASAVLAVVLLAACGGIPVEETDSSGEEPTSSSPSPDEETSTPEPSKTTTTPTPSPAATPTKKPSKKPEPVSPAVKCQNRKAQGEIFVRDTYGDDEPATAMRLGGGWVWDFGEEECIASATFALRANPGLPGYCTEVGRVADNRGYPVDRVPAPPLPSPIGVAGDC